MRTLTGAVVLCSFLAGMAGAYTVIDNDAHDWATFPNQGRHLVRDPGTGRLHAVWESIRATICYAYSTDGGNSWSTPEVVTEQGVMKYPCVALDGNGNPWAFATHTYTPVGGATRGYLYVFRRNSAGNWQWLYEDFISPFIIGAPAAVISPVEAAAAEPGGVDGSMAYVVVPYQGFLDNEPTGRHRLLFYAIDETGLRYWQTLEDTVNPQQPGMMNASIDYLPGDFIHVVYQKDLPRIYHTWTYAPGGPAFFRNEMNVPVWTDPVRVSDDYSEPGSMPSFAADGNVLTAAWVGPGSILPYVPETWMAQKFLWDPSNQWQPPVPHSNHNDNRPADHPSVSYGASSFSEPDPTQAQGQPDIWVKALTECINLSQSNDASRYPHTWAEVAPPPEPFAVQTFTVWTEVKPSIRWVVFDRREFIPVFGSEGRPSYLWVETGESIPSVYCRERAGWRQQRGHRLDYGKSRLAYRLPYLSPVWRYRLELTAYHEQPGPVEYQVLLDGRLTERFTVEPRRPATTLIDLPRAAYAADFEVELVVMATTGTEVSVADGIRVYRVPPRLRPGDGPAGHQAGTLPGLLTVRPNPVADRALIRYDGPMETPLQAAVYDVGGRRVTTLVERQAVSGGAEFDWHGLADDGRRLPAGVYFVRLRAGTRETTRSIMLAR